MKFNRENYPVINWMKSPKLSLYAIVNSRLSKTLDAMKMMYNGVDFDSSNIEYMTHPFHAAIESNKEKLLKLVDMERFSVEKSTFSGLLLLSSGESIIYNIYSLEENATKAFYSVCLVLKKTKIIAEELYHSHFMAGENREVLNISGRRWTDFVLLFHLFRQYSDLEVKHLPASTGGTPKIVGAYQNHTKSDIKIWDSLWFTTLVKSDSFKVSGHFRLQPYGPGMKERKLIWINEFTKNGYTREAKMLQEEN